MRRGAAIGGESLFLILVLSLITGQNPLQLLCSVGGLGDPSPTTQEEGPVSAPQDQLGKFASFALADTEDTRNQILPNLGLRFRYQEPRLVLFSDAVQSVCGFSSAAIGDDRLQPLSRGEVQPESWTHGTSEQRARWLQRGLQSGDSRDCDTFSGTI